MYVLCKLLCSLVVRRARLTRGGREFKTRGYTNVFHSVFPLVLQGKYIVWINICLVIEFTECFGGHFKPSVPWHNTQKIEVMFVLTYKSGVLIRLGSCMGVHTLAAKSIALLLMNISVYHK